MKMSVIFLLGAGGVERSSEHARASAELASAMDPGFLRPRWMPFVIPETPMARMQEKGRFVMPDKRMLLEELPHIY